MIRSLLRRPSFWWTLGLLLIASLVSAAVLWSYRETVIPLALDWLEATLAFIESLPPLLILLALALLPAAGFPVSALLFITGSVLGLWWGSVGASIAIGFNLTLCYWLARLFRGSFARFLARAGHEIPSAPPSEHVRLTILLRVIGIPLAIQNYLLGLSGVTFGTYLMWSWPIMAAQSVAFILVGDALFEGQVGLALIGIALVIALVIITRMIRSRLESQSKAAPVEGSPERLPTDGADS